MEEVVKVLRISTQIGAGAKREDLLDAVLAYSLASVIDSLRAYS